tara:strand:+ start:838 stop:2124 length:1287 start_codon:yes stop_codon:yes gene_type:complete
MAQTMGNPTTRTDFDVVLKEYYEGPVREHLNNKVPLLQYVEKSKRKFSGRRVVFPIHTARNSGVGGRGESGSLPTAGKQSYAESRISSKFLYGRIQLTGAVIAASTGDKGAFASAMRTEVEGMRRDLRVDLNRQVWGNLVADANASGNVGGETGILAVTSNAQAGGGGTTVNVDNPGTRYIKKGMSVSIGTVAGNTFTATSTDTVASVTNRTSFELTNNKTWAADDVVVLGDANGNSFANEITGLSFIVSESTEFNLQNISASDEDVWKSEVLTNPAGAGTNRPLSLELMQLSIDTADEISGAEPNLVMGHHSLRREYINLLTSDVRYAPEQLKGGFQKLTYAGGAKPMPIEFDRHAPYNKLFFVNTGDLKLYTMQDWKWADRDGSVMNRVSGADSWEAFMCFYGNLGCERRNSHVLLDDIEVSNLIF